jgi:hypothetical protein
VSGPLGAVEHDTVDEVVGHPHGEASDCESSSSSSSGSNSSLDEAAYVDVGELPDFSDAGSDDELPDVGLDQPQVEPPPPAPVHEVPVPRKARAGAWGAEFDCPFTIASIHRQGVHTGWGATCSLHANDGEHATCKTTLALGSGSGSLTDEECTVRLKRWLIAGLAIANTGNSHARADHMFIKPRTDCDTGLAPHKLDETLTERWGNWVG